jgi:UDP-N-acetylglucosamine:LPS N-acetylglucosamine transferase
VRREFGLAEGRRLLVAVGGSLGSGAVLRAVCETLGRPALREHPALGKLSALLVVGEQLSLRSQLREQLSSAGIQVRDLSAPDGQQSFALDPEGPEALLVQYVEDLPSVLAAADFYVGRSGAGTVGELLLARPQCLLVPDPQHADRQQFGNALPLLDAGLGRAVLQSELDGELLAEWLLEAAAKPREAHQAGEAAQRIAGDLLSRFGGDS